MSGNEKNKMVIEYLFGDTEKIAELIEELNRSGMINGSDRTLLLAIKRNIEFGMERNEIVKRMIEIGRHSPKLIALFVAVGIYRFYDN